jgi:hypothetical protein
MKKIMIIISLVAMTNFAQAQDSQSWWESLLSSVGLGDETSVEEVKGPNLDGLLGSLTENLGVTSEQAKGGLAALLNFAKQNVSQEQFEALAAQVPGLDSVMQYLPAVAQASESGLGGLLDKAANYSETLAQANDLKKQFDTLGLDTSMIQGYAQQAQAYLDTPEGAEAKKLLSDSLLNLSL